MRRKIEETVSSFLEGYKREDWEIKIEHLPFWNRFVLQAKDVRLWVDAKENEAMIVLECVDGDLCNQLMEVGIALARKLKEEGFSIDLRGGFWRFPEILKDIL